MVPNLNFEPFKEPKGFLKLLQWIFAICAFATTLNFSTKIGFDIICQNNATIPVSHTCEYPFDIDDYHIEVTLCNGNHTTFNFYGNERSNSEFFVTTGILSFIYATVLIIVYLFAEKLYSDNPRAPLIDFFVTLVFAVFWLSASAAWAHGRGQLVDAADMKNYVTSREDICLPKTGARTCVNFNQGAYGSLIISYLFGFINFILWASNLWFLYKETTWFESIIKNQGTSNAASTSGGGV